MLLNIAVHISLLRIKATLIHVGSGRVDMHFKLFCSVLLSALLLVAVTGLDAQAPAGRGAGTGSGPVVVSPQVLPDRHVTVRLYAPQAQHVSVNGIVTPAVNLSKSDEGVWEATLGPVDPALTSTHS